MSATYQVMPSLSPDELADLEASILEHGVQVPILVDEDYQIIDGHHRHEIAERNCLPCPMRVVGGTEEELRTLAFDLNLHRRHLDRVGRRELIAKSLKLDPQLSNRQHAERTGASHPTVADVRAELEQSGDVESSSTRTDSLGRTQPATKIAAGAGAGEDAEGHPVGEGHHSEPSAPAAPSSAGEDRPPAPSPAEPSPEEQALDALANTDEMQSALLAENISKAMLSVRRGLLAFDPVAVASVMNATDLADLDRLASDVAQFSCAVHDFRPTLRAIPGGK